ncbi:MAG: protein YgfX [Halofilum sp. (in: g-proteobacteria)]
MSSSTFKTTLVFERGRSRVLTAAVAGAWILGCLGVVLALDHPLTIAVVPLAIIGCRIDLQRLEPGLRLWWHGQGDWRLGESEGPAWMLDRTTWSTPWLIVLVLRGPGRTVRIPLARDAVDPTVWRRLRARLRISEGGVSEGGAA